MSELETDVLVLGGGPAGTWAAVSAAATGARVVLVDKGRCGAGGPTAFGTTSLWHIAPGPARADAVRRAYLRSEQLGDPDRMDRVLDETHRRVEDLARWGYRFPGGGLGSPRVRLDGASYLRRMRGRLRELGVRVLDHHPALQLLTDRDGVVAGASGVRQRNRYLPWTVRAGAVVVATGGCAFLSGGAGADVNTGEGLLLAVEAGAELSGMEFSSAYGLAPALNSPFAPTLARFAPDLTPYFATLYDESGAVVEGHRDEAFAAIADGRRVYAALDDAPEPIRIWLSRQSVVDPAGRIPLRPVLGGTVRGAGGLRVTGADCATTVAGLYGAGDTTTRETLTGAVSGFGGQGGAWAMASGVWAGAGAARFARTLGRPRPSAPVPGAGLHHRAGIDPRAVIGLVQEHTLPLRRSYWRSAGSLRDSISELDAMWPGAEFDLGGCGADRLRARQAAALLAVARWTKYSALARTETRGMHRRTDHPAADADWLVRLTSGGLDQVWVRREAPLPGGEPVSGRPVLGEPASIKRPLAGQESILAAPARPPASEFTARDTGVRPKAGQKSVLADPAPRPGVSIVESGGEQRAADPLPM